MTKRMPEPVRAAMYSAARHYLLAVKAAATDDTAAVLARMRAMPVNDFMTDNASLRADGRLLRQMYIFEVNKPGESNGRWDVFKEVGRSAPEQAVRPITQGGCNLAHGGNSH